MRPGQYRGRSLTELHGFSADDADLNRLGRAITTFFELSETLKLTPPEQRALLHVRAAELRALRAQPAVALKLDTGKLQRRLDYAISLMQQMADPPSS